MLFCQCVHLTTLDSELKKTMQIIISKQPLDETVFFKIQSERCIKANAMPTMSFDKYCFIQRIFILYSCGLRELAHFIQLLTRYFLQLYTIHLSSRKVSLRFHTKFLSRHFYRSPRFMIFTIDTHQNCRR